MKILLDENLPTKLKIFFNDEHDVFTVKDMGWNGKKNGELMSLLAMHKFDALVTIDKNLVYQQNTAKYSVKLFVFQAHSNRIDVLKPFVEKLLHVLTSSVIDQQIIQIENN